ncbi:hypothetical protein GCM10020001_014530 [Nonomuraea salmonea]
MAEQNCWISSAVPGSWPANWLQGMPTTVKPRGAVLALELDEGGVLRGQAAAGGHVHDQGGAAGGEGAERGGGVVEGAERDVTEAHDPTLQNESGPDL